MAKTGKPASVDGDKIAKQLCKSKQYASFRPSVMHACWKMLTDKWTMVKKMRGAILKSKAEVFKRKVDFCRVEDVCGNSLILLDKIDRAHSDKTPCHACKAVASDLDFLLRREHTYSAGRLQSHLDSLCDDVAMRHENYRSFIEDQCVILMEELGDEIVNEGKGLSGSMFMLGKSIVEAAQENYKLTSTRAEKDKRDDLQTRRNYDLTANNRVKLEMKICHELTKFCPSVDAWLPETTTRIYNYKEPEGEKEKNKSKKTQKKKKAKKAKVITSKTKGEL
jgi:hypothetical protein